jgi:pimeloyl-ACP methyl ester carboxylesterase
VTEAGAADWQRPESGEAADPGVAVDTSAAPESRTVLSADGVEIAYDVSGGGEPAMVFVHGWCGNREVWGGQVVPFSGGHLVVRIDLAGHGDSGLGRQRWTVGAFGDDVVAVVRSLDVERVILIGHSLGGSVVVAAARYLGRAVTGVIGVDTWSSVGVRVDRADIESSVLLPDMRADFPSASARFVQGLCGPTASPALVARIAGEVAAMPPDVAVAIMDEAIRQGPADLEDGLHGLDVPKSAISSETFRPKDDGLLSSFGIRNVVIPGTGHYLMLERPSAFNRELATAVDRSTGW